METKVHDFTIKTDTAPFLEAYQFSAVFFTRAKCLFNFSIASSTSLMPWQTQPGHEYHHSWDRYNHLF